MYTGCVDVYFAREFELYDPGGRVVFIVACLFRSKKYSTKRYGCRGKNDVGGTMRIIHFVKNVYATALPNTPLELCQPRADGGECDLGDACALRM